MKRKVIIVGAGASGLTSAICAARAGADVLVIERLDKPGKKILATGNGRCNYTNDHMDITCFRGYETVQACYSYVEYKRHCCFF